ncbi:MULTISPECIES: dihydrolipoyl dehydrogenase [Aminobacterium]|jgi:dihydrolipoamide dehydrogenase|uniref:Dihydrolipoyl dehydrogenase n=1 Tax=Aminobacterium colombiense (strain DSM 12261 / ALA-1) TaxID=572547 RepID=D5EGL8_AMICL|nr:MULTISPECIES: dihydrolipoyl dehydrogenase [Aminobacterium]MDD2378567.1 dihydrolipoyl dehydrogenase [Aminobacterium colombiense]ADE57700.1 dihydrolipoamide dehydrogenase [Aminobacterium colombiense DSM 12261]MDD3768611.1 dihydrolipoyl dehydrogenase [Aminobacterium colombiense]MDD4265295.1 dihydrolipoyl dehydrogenase [Aminobacterium colombiense]MDD4585289.1 dihydrolipoyl dehydrogenase [Aminobacterium colombiense]
MAHSITMPKPGLTMTEGPAPIAEPLPSVGEQKKHVVIIGGGPGGYVAAIRASQLGARVTLVEKKRLGGVCLNVGCIPTKVLLHSVELFTAIKKASHLGIVAEKVSVDWNALMKRKEKVVDHLTGGVGILLKSNDVEVIDGFAKFLSPRSVGVKLKDGGETRIEADSFIIATGSEPVIPAIRGFDIPGVITSNEALSLEKVPSSMVVVGGGVIGMEFASIYASLGTKVTVVEMLPDILLNMDEELVQIIKGVLARSKVVFHTSSKVTEVKERAGVLAVSVESPDGTVTVEAEKVLVSVGRRPVINGLGLEKAGVITEKGRIRVDSYLRTNVSHIYGIGDCASPIMLAHVASREGIVAAENIMGRSVTMDYKTVPSAIYTSPEIASVGLTERQAREKGFKVKVGRFPLANNGKCIIMNDIDGLVKYVIHEKYNEILGVHIIGPRATDLIVEGALALRLEATAEEIISTIHAHPTIGEALAEGALAALGRVIHLPAKK